MFSLAVDFEYLWKYSSESHPTNIFGFGLGVKEDPPVVGVDSENLFKSFSEGRRKFSEKWKKIIAPLNMADLDQVLNIRVNEVRIPADLWARILFDYIVAFRDELVERPILLKSLIPIYYIRTLGFVNETREMDTKEAEDFLEVECRIMEEEIYYLIAKWNQTPRKDGIPSIAQYLAD